MCSGFERPCRTMEITMKIEVKHAIEILTMTDKEILDFIDAQFSWAKRFRKSRYSVEWGAWSREMNIGLTTWMKDPLSDRNGAAKYIFLYWQKTSELVELHYKTKPFFKKGMKNKLAKQLKKDRAAIIAGRAPELLTQKELRQRLLSGPLSQRA